MKNLLTLLLVLVAGVHAYFYFSFSAFHPCDAALGKMKSDCSKLGAIEGGICSGVITLGEKMGGSKFLQEEKGIFECYSIAFVGTDVQSLMSK